MKKHILLSLAAIILSFTSCTKPEEGGKGNPPAPQEQIVIPSTVDVKPVVSPEGGDTRITFTAASAWTASVISTKADSWVDVNPKSGDPGTAEITITTTPNDTYVERNATIQIKCGNETKDIVLTQKQLDNITVTTDKVELGVEGGSFTIELKSNIDFSYEIDGDWIKYVSTKAYSDKTLTFSAEPNEGVQKREGSVTVKGGGFSETVKVYQSGEEPTLIITQNEYNLEAEGGSITVEVSSNVAVTMTIPESAGWITENSTKSVSTSTFHLDVAANETKEARSAEITFSNEESGLSEKVTVNQEGNTKTPVPEMVDLGLSVKWASFNVGASKPEEYGGYYTWAGLEDVTSTSIYLYLDYNCPYHEGREYTSGWTKYVPSDKSSYWSGSGSPDDKTVLDLEDDIAHVTLGGKWRMPTDAEWMELYGNCSSEWTSLNGVYGRKYTSKKNGNSIFLPAAGYRGDTSLYSAGSFGYFWSSSLCTDEPCEAGEWAIGPVPFVSITHDVRFTGLTVRPVNGDKVSVTGVSLEPASLSLNVREAYSLTATIIPSNAPENGVTWFSSDPSVATVDKNGKVTGIKEGNATITVTTNDGGYTATCSVKVKISEPTVPEMVDLGLSVKWASFNIGATKPEAYGGYYQWAGLDDVTSTSIYLEWDNCPYYFSYGFTKYVPSDDPSSWTGSGSPDNKSVIEPEDDVAHMTLGGKWRIPTDAEWGELINSCTWTWTQLNGVNGYRVTSNKSGYADKWIFLPAAGYRDGYDLNNVSSNGSYWSSSLYLRYPTRTYELGFSSGGVHIYDFGLRYEGRSVRPVYDDKASETETVNFPDEALRRYMIQNFDLNRDGAISLYEASKVEEIRITTTDIESLSGIEYCTELKSLTCVGRGPIEKGNLKSVDVSKNPKLEHLDLAYNMLESLDVSNNVNLKSLYCSENNLSALDLSHCTKLETFEGDGIETINISNTNLNDNRPIFGASRIVARNCRSMHHLKFQVTSSNCTIDTDIPNASFAAFSDITTDINFGYSEVENVFISSFPKGTGYKSTMTIHSENASYMEFRGAEAPQTLSFGNGTIDYVPKLKYVYLYGLPLEVRYSKKDENDLIFNVSYPNYRDVYIAKSNVINFGPNSAVLMGRFWKYVKATPIFVNTYTRSITNAVYTTNAKETSWSPQRDGYEWYPVSGVDFDFPE